MIVNFEVTDTFGGDANYSWVRRETVTMPDSVSNLAIVRRAKKFAGFTGIRCRTANYGDTIELRPAGICQVLFVSFGETDA